MTLVALLLVSANAGAASGAAEQTRAKIGLALSGGGARGAAHIGVLKILEQYRVPVDYIAGTSMGAIVGGLYASGMTADELETLITNVDWADAFADRAPRKDRSFRRKRDDDLYLVKNKPGVSLGGFRFPMGILDAQKIDLLLKRFTLPVVTVRDFDDLSIPFRAVATDIATGRAVVLDHGDLALAMRASMSIPVVFAPREIGGELLIDGGVASNLPIDVVRRMGADIVIAVDISEPLLEQEEIRSVVTVTDQLLSILTRRNTDKQIASLTDDDILIRPDLGDIKTASFDRAADAIPDGVAGAESVLDRLESLSLSDAGYRAHRAARRRPAAAPLVIDEVRIVDDSRLADTAISTLISTRAGQTLDVDRMERDLDRIYGLGVFESVYYDITMESDRTVLTVTARENSWGPNYMQFGVAVFEDYARANFNLAAAFTRMPINGLCGEWRTGIQVGQEPNVFTEWHQPIDHGLRKYVHLLAFAGDRAVNVFDEGGHKLTEWDRRGYGGYGAVGRELGTWGDFRLGLLRERGKMRIQVGDPSLPDMDFDTGEVFAQFYVDELDNVSIPRSGGRLRVRVNAGLEALGSDTEYEQGRIDGSYPYTRGRYTGLFGGSFGTTRDSDAPFQSQFHLGGFTRLSGLEHDEISGQHYALLYAIFYRRMWNSDLLPGYLGASFEYGNTFAERSQIAFDSGIVAGSAFFALDTFIGPVYLGYGLAEGGRSNYYLFLGLTPTHGRPGFGINDE